MKFLYNPKVEKELLDHWKCYSVGSDDMMRELKILIPWMHDMLMGKPFKRPILYDLWTNESTSKKYPYEKYPELYTDRLPPFLKI
jgi:hypothetical protein